MTIAIISHEDCLLHVMPDDQEERPNRLETVNRTLETYPFKNAVTYVDAPMATKEQLALAHTSEHVEKMFELSPKEGLVELEYDTFLCPHTLNAARRAAGAVIQAVDLVMDKTVKAAFCSVRPPGHHAEIERAMGFCFFNNVAIGVKHVLEKYNLKKVLVIDFDVHHGNGTQHIFQNDPRVFFYSSFEHPLYPGYDPTNDNDHIFYLPLTAGTEGETFRKLVQEKWLYHMMNSNPDFIFISAGFDAHWRDPLGHLKLNEQDYQWLTAEIVKIANAKCQGRIVSVLEGGYSLEALSESVPVHVDALL